MSLFEKFIPTTAWEIEGFPSYGVIYLTILFVGLILCFTFAYLLRKDKGKKIDWMIFGIGVFLIIIEVYKQFFHYYVYRDGHYQWWIFPFQLCSVPMYICVIIPFIKNMKFKNMLYSFLMVFNFFGGFVALLEPSGLIVHPAVDSSMHYLTLIIHALIWHFALVFIGLYLFFTKTTANKITDYFKCLPVLGVVIGIAQIINVIMKGREGMNMFYISPYAPSNIVVFETIYAECGWFVNMIVYILALLIGSFIFYCLFYYGRILINKMKNKNVVANN